MCNLFFNVFLANQCLYAHCYSSRWERPSRSPMVSSLSKAFQPEPPSEFLISTGSPVSTLPRLLPGLPPQIMPGSFRLSAIHHLLKTGRFTWTPPFQVRSHIMRSVLIVFVCWSNEFRLIYSQVSNRYEGKRGILFVRSLFIVKWETAPRSPLGSSLAKPLLPGPPSELLMSTGSPTGNPPGLLPGPTLQIVGDCFRCSTNRHLAQAQALYLDSFPSGETCNHTIFCFAFVGWSSPICR